MTEQSDITCGPYRLSEQVGQGGMGVVFKGSHRREGTSVAVKVMTSRLAHEEENQKEFRREVQAMAKLHHPAIARVLDYGTVGAETAERAEVDIVEGAPWCAMEFVEGDDLLEVAGHWEWPQVEQFLLVLLDALAHAHANDIVHRDLKPSNILITDETPGALDLKLVDFGIAHVFNPEGTERAPDSWGTPEVMAPEQILGEWRNQGPWTDLYALGCVTWWMVCHRVPFSGEERSDTYLQHMSGKKGSFEPVFEVPDGLGEWLERMLMVDHRARFQRAADAAYALVRLAQMRPMSGANGAEDPTGELGFDSESLTTLRAVTEGTPSGSTGRGASASPEAATSPSMSIEQFAMASTPPIADDWRRAEAPRPDVPAEGTGLALFDLRKIPVIDRQEERDRLWAALNMVHRTQQPTAMLLRGPAGSGKSRLADWIARRGHELGALQVLKATHSPKGGPRDGIGPMFARHFRCDGLPWSEGFERLQQHYESLGVERSACFHDAVGVTRMMGLQVDVEAPPGFQNPKEKHFALRRLLARLADRRPLLLWLDDVAWGWESARFAEFLLEETYRESLPVFVLMTAREQAMEARPQVRQMVDRIREHEFGRDVPVDPLDRPAHRQLVERMLKLDDRLIEEIVERTEGNPLFAIQLVGDWVERGILEGSDGGFALRSDAERPIPDGPHDLWKRRITRVLAVLPEGERQQGLVAMQLAAALGRHIDTPEWRAVCRRAGVEAREKLVEELVEYGLARREGEGWSFVHTLLQESLERLARRQGRWARLHRICAGAIRALYPERVDRTAARRAEHLIEADDLDAALAPLLQAAQRARTMGAFREHGQWIERRGEVLDELGVDESDRRRVQNTFHRAYSALNTGDSERARQLLEETERAARQHGWVRELGDALRLKAQLFQDDGQIKRCLELVDEADRSYRQAHYFLGRAHCQTTKGRALVFRGDFDGAREAFGKAMSIFEALDYPNDVLRNEAWTTYTYIYQGEYRRSRGRARDVLERARELGDKNTEADAWNQLGEVARFEREWGEARRYYQRAAREYEQIGYRGVYIARMNMAMVEIPAGHYRRARREFAEVEQSLPEVGLRSRMPHVYAGLLGAAAGLEDWEAVDELLPRIEESYAANEGASKDTAWLAEHAARLSWQGGARGRAERLFRLARDIWAHLGDRGRVDEIDRRIGQGGDGGAG